VLFAACAVAVQLDCDYIRALREAGTPMPKIGRTVTVNTGKNAGNPLRVRCASARLPRARPRAPGPIRLRRPR
jgi:hypothetical protein